MTDVKRQTFEMALERVRRSYDLCVYRYIIIPEHVYLLFTEGFVSGVS